MVIPIIGSVLPIKYFFVKTDLISTKPVNIRKYSYRIVDSRSILVNYKPSSCT
jgi:hypothetical protein